MASVPLNHLLRIGGLHLMTGVKHTLSDAVNNLKGLTNKTTVFNADGSIVETNTDGSKTTTVFNEDGSITETVVCDGVTYEKTTVFNADGSITETSVKK